MSILKVKDWKYRFNPKLQNIWDATGYKNNPHYMETQDGKSGWGNTLLTKINEISAHIHMATLAGGADTVEIHSSHMPLIYGMEYYNYSLNKIGHRYDIVVNDFISKDLVLVYKSNFPSSLPESKIKMTMGIVKIKNII